MDAGYEYELLASLYCRKRLFTIIMSHGHERIVGPSCRWVSLWMYTQFNNDLIAIWIFHPLVVIVISVCCQVQSLRWWNLHHSKSKCCHSAVEHSRSDTHYVSSGIWVCIHFRRYGSYLWSIAAARSLLSMSECYIADRRSSVLFVFR